MHTFRKVSQFSLDKSRKAEKEIEATFGMYPTFFEIIPDYQVPGMWAYFGAVNGPQNAIPPKYRELINLAVAAQIPCDYCIYSIPKRRRDMEPAKMK